MKSLKKQELKLTASLNAVIAQFHKLPTRDRVDHIVKRTEQLSDTGAANYLEKVMHEFSHRHRNFESVLMDHFAETEKIYGDLKHFSRNKKLLLGALLTKEYSFQAAALFNPSIVPHPDQDNLKNGEQRFIMSLRATGEGHISSIIFKTGIVDQEGSVSMDKTDNYFSVIKKEETAGADDTNYNLLQNDTRIPEKVIFPSGKYESMGMEDVRLVKFIDGKESCYYGTYTAYNGKQIRTMLLETNDFNSFRIRSLHGEAINDKGMALFPEKVNGRFVMCSRQGSEKLSIMFSDDLYKWDKYQLLKEPEFEWEFVQIGNCGSPVKTNKGWLLLTHGVGAMRKYVISAILLDLNNPAKIIGRLHEPMIMAEEEEREGYVPNVVYTCGMMKHGDLLIIPYAISDTAIQFASVAIDDILNEMK